MFIELRFVEAVTDPVEATPLAFFAATACSCGMPFMVE